MRLPTRKHLVMLAAIGLAGVSVEAHVTKQTNSLDSYWFLVHHVPDLDQVRTVLPGYGDQLSRPGCATTTGARASTCSRSRA